MSEAAITIVVICLVAIMVVICRRRDMVKKMLDGYSIEKGLKDIDDEIAESKKRRANLEEINEGETAQTTEEVKAKEKGSQDAERGRPKKIRRRRR